MVEVLIVTAESLQDVIQLQKNSGKRILSIGISKFKKDSTRSLNYDVTEFVVVVR